MIQVESVTKSFGAKRALDGVTFTVADGETADLPGMRFVTVFAALDPEAGKSVLQFWDRFAYGGGRQSAEASPRKSSSSGAS